MTLRVFYIISLLLPYGIVAQDVMYDLPVTVVLDSFDQAFSQYNRDMNTEPELGMLSKMGLVSAGLLYDATGITRSNGPGKVTTFTKHGLPSEHTKVFWNKIEINSPLNGIVDFSTLPTFLLSNRTNLYAQQPKEIELRSVTSHSGQLDILLKTGAFNTYDVGARQSFSIGRTTYELGFQYSSSDNDFRYSNDLGQTVRQQNGQYEQIHGLFQVQHKFSSRARLNANLLYSHIETQIPPTIYQKESRANQKNTPFRWQATYKHQGLRSNWTLFGGSNIESLQYIDPNLQLDVTHQFSRHTIGTNWKQNIFSSSTYLLVDLRETYEIGQSDNFTEKQQNLLSHGFASIQSMIGEQFVAKGGLGIENGRDIWSPLQYAFDLTYLLTDRSRMTATLKSLYRLPTYNELYWFPGGNTALKPESGFAGILDYFQVIGDIKYEVGASVYRLNNRILWLPNSTGLFAPTNVGKIGSEEVFGGCNISKPFRKSRLEIGLRYTYLHGHIIEYTNSPQSNGKQLPFTPQHSLSHHISWQMEKWGAIKLTGKYQSKSYTNTNNSETIDGFYVAALEANHTWRRPRFIIQFFITIQNITNQTYYLSNGYPQPGTNWSTGCYLKLNKKQNDI